MRRTVRWIGIGLAALWLAGCEQMSSMSWRRSAPAPAPASPATAGPQPVVRKAGPADYLAGTAVKADSDAAGQGAVDVALEWSRKYAQASDALMTAQKEIKNLHEANKQLSAQTARTQIQLEQSQKELAEANDMLVEMGKELREWKANVLGFRNEMQQAQQVQMDAIKKIMVLLGGEVVPAGRSAEKPAVSAKEAAGETPKRPNI